MHARPYWPRERDARLHCTAVWNAMVAGAEYLGRNPFPDDEEPVELVRCGNCDEWHVPTGETNHLGDPACRGCSEDSYAREVRYE